MQYDVNFVFKLYIRNEQNTAGLLTEIKIKMWKTVLQRFFFKRAKGNTQMLSCFLGCKITGVLDFFIYTFFNNDHLLLLLSRKKKVFFKFWNSK